MTPRDPLSWPELQQRAAPEPERVNGPTNAQAHLRLFGHGPEEVRVTLYRDHHAWCPYCQKVWLWLEERRVPYRVRKVSMVCYGEKEAWFRRLVPSGMLPALELDGHLHTESDRILLVLERAFGPLHRSLEDHEVMALRRLERRLFGAWCAWLCRPRAVPGGERRARQAFEAEAGAMEDALGRTEGPFLLDAYSVADGIAVPYLERMAASLAYYKGYLVRERYPLIDRWFRALETRSTYLGTQSDFHTHAHDLPPQMGGCVANGEPEQRRLALRIDQGPWPLLGPGRPDPETSQAAPAEAAALALTRVLRHRQPLLARYGRGDDAIDRALRCALSALVGEGEHRPPAGTAAQLRALRDRICVPRDMPLHAARRLRQALEATAALDPQDPGAAGPPLPQGHRLDQDPRPFLEPAREPA